MDSPKAAVPRLSFSACLNQQATEDYVSNSVEEKTAGLTFKEALRVARPETDRSTSSDRINPASDALLVNLVDKLPRDLGRMTWGAIKRWLTFGSGAPEAISTVQRQYQIGQEKPIDEKALLSTLCSVMAQHPEFTPHIGPEHLWSPESKAGFGVSFPSRLKMALQGERPLPSPIFGSKLVSALGLGATALTLPTGQEKPLKDWVCEQKDGSIELHQLFGESYRLNQGDLYATLLCAENVLSEGLYTPDRQEREVTKKLSYLRSDSSPSGDNFGAWYHLMGSALYTMVRPEWKAKLVMKIEDAGSYILEGSDPQEDHINQLGIELGKALRQVAEEGLPPSAKTQPYINLSEFSWDRHQTRTWKTAA